MVVRRALGIAGLSEAVTFVLGFANVVIVSRLLRPDEIGVFSVAVSVLGFAHIFREFGVGQYLVQAAELGREQFRAAVTVSIASSWLIAVVLFLISKPMAVLYGHAGIGEVLAMLAVNFLIMPFGAPLLSVLRRELQFGKLAWATVLGAVVQTVVTIAAAMHGASYLSMAWGSIAMHVFKTSFLNYLRPGETFVWPTLRGLGDVLKFGSLISVGSIVRQVGSSAPDLIFGRTLGFVEVAIFSRGVGLQKMAIERIESMVRSVHFPTFASSLRQGGDAAALYTQASAYLIAVTVPALAVLATLAEPLILFVFGEQWARSVPIAQVYCVATMLTAPYSLFTLSLTAAGRAALCLRTELISQTVRVAALLGSIWLDLHQVVWLLLLAHAAEAWLSQWALKQAFGLGGMGFLRGIWRGLVLVPFAVSGPLLLVMSASHVDFLARHPLALLLCGGSTALAGWLLGLRVLGHPVYAEVQRVLDLRRRWA
jgi:O-antigen/teichoic acid export membrane protein